MNILIMTRMVVAAVLACLLFSAGGFAIPKSDEHSTRIVDKPLSDQQHYDGEEHNPEYDHEAFLGDEAKEFDQLTPEESRQRLALIVEKIDKNSDGYINQVELMNWIRYTQRKYVGDDVEKQWKIHNPDNEAPIEWSKYKKATYGNYDEREDNELADEEGFSYKDMIRRDKRRWDAADQDKDESLNKEEFTAFLHPEEAEHMRDIVVLETMEDIDKDKDGKVNLEEYIGDMYRGGSDDEEPDWVKGEKEQFNTYRDKDGNGYMDTEEVKNWIIPPDYDHAEAEARHLIYEADSDKDTQLSKEEVLEKYDLFVGSQATDFGEALTRHDEF